MSTRRKPPSRAPRLRTVESTGIKIQARHKYNATLPTPPPGEHLWTLLGVWRITDPTADHVDLDIENLLSIEGPGCFVCERPYAVAVAGPCPGEPR